jgi:glycosyltransferase involved in cell wall biosynthesis
MRILLLGEYSNVHWTLAEGLRQLGHEVTVASNGDFWKDYPRDIDFARQPGKWGGIKLMAKIYANLPRFRDYDVVQLINPIFFELKAERLFPIYRYLRRHNKKMVLGAMGMDWYWVHTCTNDKPLRYSDFNFGDQLRTDAPALKEQADWLGTTKERLNKLIANDCDGIVTGLYEYDVCYQRHFPEKTRFIPFPIKPAHHSPLTDQQPPLRLFIGISRERSVYKGTDIMLRAAEDIVAKYPNRVELRKAEGVPFAQYQHMMDGSDAILDQLYSYTPSMNPLLAMSKGIICIGGGEPENYEILGETELRPIINVEPNYESVYHELEQLVLHPERIAELKRQSIEYICRHHDYIKVARQYEQFYQTLNS